MDNPGELKCAYAIAHLKDGSNQFEVMTRDGIMKDANSVNGYTPAASNTIPGLNDYNVFIAGWLGKETERELPVRHSLRAMC